MVGAGRGGAGTTDCRPSLPSPSPAGGPITVATSRDARRDVTLFTTRLRAGNMRWQRAREGVSSYGVTGAKRSTGGSNGAPGSPRGHLASAGGLLIAPLRSRHLSPFGRGGACSAARVAAAARAARVPPVGSPAENDRRSASTPGGRRCAGVELVVASCVAPRWLCVLPRSDLPRYREAHGCAVRSRDMALAPHMLRRWLWLVLPDAASRSCARSATVERRRQLAGHGMQLAPANLPRRAVHSQTHPPSRADDTAGPEPKQEKVSCRRRGVASTMSQVRALVNVR